jgi:hypothetical protein
MCLLIGHSPCNPPGLLLNIIYAHPCPIYILSDIELVVTCTFYRNAHNQRCVMVWELDLLGMRCTWNLYVKYRWHHSAEAPTGRSSCHPEKSDSKHSAAVTIRWQRRTGQCGSRTSLRRGWSYHRGLAHAMHQNRPQKQTCRQCCKPST